MSPTPFCSPSPRLAGEGAGGEGGLAYPRLTPAGYPLSPRHVGADLINEPLTHDASCLVGR
jgi:hypothetical protein